MKKTHTMVVRQPQFEHERGAGGLWNARMPELSHTLNGFQLALPYLEPYFIDAIRSAERYVNDPELLEDMRAFCAQEAQHSRQHRQYCKVLRRRYPRLIEFETQIQKSLVDSRRNDSLEWRLAYTAGYEALTAELACWLMRNERVWFRDADTEFAEMMTWHAAEEIEHRHVAFDVLQAVNPSPSLRARGLLAALCKTLWDMIPAVSYMLEVDGYRGRPSSWARRLFLHITLQFEVAPALGRYLTPSYHPSYEKEPEGIAAWVRANPAKSAQKARVG